MILRMVCFLFILTLFIIFFNEIFKNISSSYKESNKHYLLNVSNIVEKDDILSKFYKVYGSIFVLYSIKKKNKNLFLNDSCQT